MQPDEYRKLAAVEDRMWYFHALNRRIDFWLARSLHHDRPVVLDAGCGTGGLIRHLQRCHPTWRITGLDFEPLACDLARESATGEVIQGSVTDLPFAEGAFDAIVSADVVCQVEDGTRALREFARCVRPGGVVVVNVPAYRALWSYHDDSCQTRHRYTRPELCQLFRAAGFDVTFSSYANCLALPLIWARRKLFRPARPTSDVRLYPPVIEAVFAGMAWAEFAWHRLGIASPAGSSVFVAGVRRTPG